MSSSGSGRESGVSRAVGSSSSNGSSRFGGGRQDASSSSFVEARTLAQTLEKDDSRRRRGQDPFSSGVQDAAGGTGRSSANVPRSSSSSSLSTLRQGGYPPPSSSSFAGLEGRVAANRNNNRAANASAQESAQEKELRARAQAMLRVDMEAAEERERNDMRNRLNVAHKLRREAGWVSFLPVFAKFCQTSGDVDPDAVARWFFQQAVLAEKAGSKDGKGGDLCRCFQLAKRTMGSGSLSWTAHDFLAALRPGPVAEDCLALCRDAAAFPWSCKGGRSSLCAFSADQRGARKALELGDEQSLIGKSMRRVLTALLMSSVAVASDTPMIQTQINVDKFSNDIRNTCNIDDFNFQPAERVSEPVSNQSPDMVEEFSTHSDMQTAVSQILESISAPESEVPKLIETLKNHAVQQIIRTLQTKETANWKPIQGDDGSALKSDIAESVQESIAKGDLDKYFKPDAEFDNGVTAKEGTAQVLEEFWKAVVESKKVAASLQIPSDAHYFWKKIGVVAEVDTGGTEAVKVSLQNDIYDLAKAMKKIQETFPQEFYEQFQTNGGPGTYLKEASDKDKAEVETIQAKTAEFEKERNSLLAFNPEKNLEFNARQVLQRFQNKKILMLNGKETKEVIIKKLLKLSQQTVENILDIKVTQDEKDVDNQTWIFKSVNTVILDKKMQSALGTAKKLKEKYETQDGEFTTTESKSKSKNVQSAIKNFRDMNFLETSDGIIGDITTIENLVGDGGEVFKKVIPKTKEAISELKATIAAKGDQIIKDLQGQVEQSQENEQNLKDKRDAQEQLEMEVHKFLTAGSDDIVTVYSEIQLVEKELETVEKFIGAQNKIKTSLEKKLADSAVSTAEKPENERILSKAEISLEFYKTNREELQTKLSKLKQMKLAHEREMQDKIENATQYITILQKIVDSFYQEIPPQVIQDLVKDWNLRTKIAAPVGGVLGAAIGLGLCCRSRVKEKKRQTERQTENQKLNTDTAELKEIHRDVKDIKNVLNSSTATEAVSILTAKFGLTKKYQSFPGDVIAKTLSNLQNEVVQKTKQKLVEHMKAKAADWKVIGEIEKQFSSVPNDDEMFVENYFSVVLFWMIFLVDQHSSTPFASEQDWQGVGEEFKDQFKTWVQRTATEDDPNGTFQTILSGHNSVSLLSGFTLSHFLQGREGDRITGVRGEEDVMVVLGSGMNPTLRNALFMPSALPLEQKLLATQKLSDLMETRQKQESFAVPENGLELFEGDQQAWEEAKELNTVLGYLFPKLLAEELRDLQSVAKIDDAAAQSGTIGRSETSQELGGEEQGQVQSSVGNFLSKPSETKIDAEVLDHMESVLERYLQKNLEKLAPVLEGATREELQAVLSTIGHATAKFLETGQQNIILLTRRPSAPSKKKEVTVSGASSFSSSSSSLLSSSSSSSLPSSSLYGLTSVAKVDWEKQTEIKNWFETKVNTNKWGSKTDKPEVGVQDIMELNQFVEVIRNRNFPNKTSWHSFIVDSNGPFKMKSPQYKGVFYGVLKWMVETDDYELVTNLPESVVNDINEQYIDFYEEDKNWLGLLQLYSELTLTKLTGGDINERKEIEELLNKDRDSVTKEEFEKICALTNEKTKKLLTEYNAMQKTVKNMATKQDLETQVAEIKDLLQLPASASSGGSPPPLNIFQKLDEVKNDIVSETKSSVAQAATDAATAAVATAASAVTTSATKTTLDVKTFQTTVEQQQKLLDSLSSVLNGLSKCVQTRARRLDPLRGLGDGSATGEGLLPQDPFLLQLQAAFSSQSQIAHFDFLRLPGVTKGSTVHKWLETQRDHLPPALLAKTVASIAEAATSGQRAPFSSSPPKGEENLHGPDPWKRFEGPFGLDVSAARKDREERSSRLRQEFAFQLLTSLSASF